MALSKRQAFANARAALPQRHWHSLLARACISGAIALVFVWLLASRISNVSIPDLQARLYTVSSGQWLTAIMATIISFWAVGHYDGVIHRYLATGARPSDAQSAGVTAIAVGQTLGLGVITGAIVRWRMLPDQTLWQATKITSLIALFFIMGWAVVTAAVVMGLPQAPFKTIAVCTLAVAAVLILISGLTRSHTAVRWPNLFVIGRLLGLTAIDTLMAGFALWVLCPPDLALPFATLLPAFLIAFGAGLISGAPGGVGAFEITLLALLPTLPEAPLLAAVLAWRLIYFAGPAIIGAAFAIRGPMRRRRATAALPCNRFTKIAARAEVGLLAQGHLTLSTAGFDQAWLTGRTAHCLIGLLDPMSDDPQTGAASCDHKLAISALIDTANSESRMPVIYKCTARTAAAARQMGLKLRPIAREAWLDPRRFALATPSRANLRRKLRRAAAAGISVTTDPPNWPALAGIAAEWAACHGGERGFSMGRFDPDYLKTQRIYVAILGTTPVAFATFHIGKYEWTLDLMRYSSSAPDGTMHRLIAQAIDDAAAQTVPRLSLAAVPLAALIPPPAGRLAASAHRLSGGKDAGLAQFKSAFAPNWQTLYLAAPHKPGLVLSGAEISREVMRPRPIGSISHHDHDEYEIATAR